jgi:GxxExxY protein
VSLDYKGRAIGEGRVDLVVGRLLLVELKAVEELGRIHEAQVMSYLKTLNLHLGLLINFNVPLLKDGIRRILS